MSSLVPVQRPDYTGKVVTRHVKSATNTPGARRITPPTLVSSNSVEHLRGRLAEAFQLPLNDLPKCVTDASRLEALLSLAQAHDFTVSGPELMSSMSWLEDDEFDACVRIVDRNFDLADAVMSSLPSKVLAFRASVPMLVVGINQHEFDMTPDDEAVLVGVLCKIWVSDVLDNEEGYLEEIFQYRTSSTGKYEPRSALYDDLAQYIVNNPDKSDMITSIIIDRKVSDAAEIDRMLNTVASPTLFDGVL